MIYIHDKNGDVANTYDQMSSIEYILEYDCRGQNINMEIDKSKKRFLHVACQDKRYMQEWIIRHEVLLEVIHDGYMKYTTPDWCVSTGDGYFSYFMRSPIKIDWNQDYHFYFDKPYSKTARA